MKGKIRRFLHFLGMTTVCVFALFAIMPVCVHAAGTNENPTLSVEVLGQDSKYQDNSFVNLVSIPNSLLTYENNGGQTNNNELSKAFDGNWNTNWISGVDNNVPAENPFYNTVTVQFNQTVTIDSMLYAASNSKSGYGFPTKFNIYSSVGDGEFELVGYGEQTATASKIRIVFPEAIECDQLMFEYREVNKAHKWVASAKEFVFLQPSEEIEKVYHLFTDYAKYEIRPEYASVEAIQGLRKKFENYVNYEENIKLSLDRAENILNGTIAFDKQREFSTSENAVNKIERRGDIVSHARKTLKFNAFGTNRQVTGIAARTGETVKIYVEGKQGDKLPRIRFSQAYGHWGKWLGGELQLSLGLNEFIVPDFKTSDYSKEVVSGGSIYLVNPYTEQEQSSEVKVYFESGDVFPVFRKGDDENLYKKQLAEYIDRVNADPDRVVDVTELVSDHTIMTVQASRANQIYKSASPQKNMENWDTTMKEMLRFLGVSFEEGEPYYDVKNNYLNVNYRTSQNWSGGFMFAHTEHIGLYAGGSEDTLINSLNAGGGSQISWGFCHEAGHMLDIPERTVGETSNNMVANYNNTYKLGIIRNENYLNSTLTKLSSDRTLEKNLWDSDRYNYMVYWLIQSLYTDYWGDQENLYRYKNDVSGLSKTEKQVYFSSLATGIDLSYYFERWGYYIPSDGKPFTYETASDAFKNYISQAKNEGKIKDEIKKFWYFDSAQFNYMMDHADLKKGIGGMYDDTMVTNIVSVHKSANGYNVALPIVEKQEHLGYEILEGNEEDGYTVIGFTHTNTFKDTTTYEEGYVPEYKAVAYDRLLDHARESVSVKPVSQEAVCELNGEIYDSLSEAVEAANSGDTIYLLKNITDAGIAISKNITIKIKEDVNKDIMISKSGSDFIFNVNAGAALTLEGYGEHNIVLDGNGLKQGYALIGIAGNGRLTIHKNVVLQNGKNTGNGGAIYTASASGRVEVTNVIFRNNSAGNGGAIYNTGTMTLTNCEFTDNRASGSGGAISNAGGGVMTVTNTNITGNKGKNGGAVFADGNTTLRNVAVKDNTAGNGGAVYISPGRNAAARTLTLDKGTNVCENNTDNDSAFYIDKSATVIVNSATIRDSVYINSGNLQVQGSNAVIAGKIYKNTGNILLKGKMLNPETSKITLALANYNAGDILLTSDFDLTEEDLSILELEDGIVCKYAVSEDKRSICLEESIVVYSVVLKANGGDINSGDVARYVAGTEVVLPTDVTKEDYIFGGWYEKEDFSGEPVAKIPADSTGDKTYYAKWIQKQEEPDKEKEINISKLTITGISKKIAAGKKVQLAVKVVPADATNKAVIWHSSNSKVASVNSKGIVSMKKRSGGKKVTITATATDGSGVKANYKITSMKGVVKKVAVSGSKSVKAGKSLKLKAKVTATKKANKKLKWSSSNVKYAKVSSSGKVKTYKAGKGKKVKITAMATDGSGKKKTVTIRIK